MAQWCMELTKCYCCQYQGSCHGDGRKKRSVSWQTKRHKQHHGVLQKNVFNDRRTSLLLPL